MKNKQTKNLTQTAMFTALILTLTYFHTPMPNANGGYIHLGDAIIFLASCFLPLPYPLFAAAIGAGLADVVSGFAIWAPFTVIIKMLLCLPFTNKNNKILCKRNFIALFVCAIISMAGYYLAEGIIYGNFITPVLSITGNLTQSIGSSVVFLLVAAGLDKADFKGKI